TPESEEFFAGVKVAAAAKPHPQWLVEYKCSRSAKNLLVFCATLQEYRDPDPWFLSARMAGEIIGRSHQLANRLFWALVNYGLLEEVKKGQNANRLASEWRYLGPAV